MFVTTWWGGFVFVVTHVSCFEIKESSDSHANFGGIHNISIETCICSLLWLGIVWQLCWAQIFSHWCIQTHAAMHWHLVVKLAFAIEWATVMFVILKSESIQFYIMLYWPHFPFLLLGSDILYYIPLNILIHVPRKCRAWTQCWYNLHYCRKICLLGSKLQPKLATSISWKEWHPAIANANLNYRTGLRPLYLILGPSEVNHSLYHYYWTDCKECQLVVSMSFQKPSKVAH